MSTLSEAPEVVALRAEAAFNPEWNGKDPTTDADVAASFVYHDCDAETLDCSAEPRGITPGERQGVPESRSHRASRDPGALPPGISPGR